MGDLITAVVTIGGLGGILWFILRGMRSGHGQAKSLRGLNRYGNPQPWATAVLSGLAVAVIADTMGGPTVLYGALALGVGVACGMGDRKSPFVQLAAGLVGALAAVCTSYRFVADSGPDLVLNLTLTIGLAAVFGLLGVFRRRPHDGLTWFAVVEILVFLLSPLGNSLLDLPMANGLGALGIAIVVVVGLALLAPALLTIFAAAVALAPLGTVALGSGDLTAQLTYLALTLLGFAPIAFARRRMGMS